MRVRCRFCGAEYDAEVTPAALGLVYRCEQCGRAGLRPAGAEHAESCGGARTADPRPGDEPPAPGS